MSNTKHSHGEWVCTFNSVEERGVRNTGGYICFLPKPHRYSGQDERYAQELAENEANAKIIAAAPELLEALQLVLAAFPGGTLEDQMNEDYYKVKSAIEKATK